jgi:hypothetical protein
MFCRPAADESVAEFETRFRRAVDVAATAKDGVRALLFRLADDQLLPNRARSATHRYLALFEHDDVAELDRSVASLILDRDDLLCSVFAQTTLVTAPSPIPAYAPPRPPEPAPPQAGPGIFITFTRPIDEAGDAEYNRWYDEHHVPDALHMSGFRRARRFKVTTEKVAVADDRTTAGPEPALAPYLAVYEIDDTGYTSYNREIQPWIESFATIYYGPDEYDKQFTQAFIFEQLIEDERG